MDLPQPGQRWFLLHRFSWNIFLAHRTICSNDRRVSIALVDPLLLLPPRPREPLNPPVVVVFMMASIFPLQNIDLWVLDEATSLRSKATSFFMSSLFPEPDLPLANVSKVIQCFMRRWRSLQAAHTADWIEQDVLPSQPASLLSQ